MVDNISIETAERLCEEFRRERKIRLFSQCWGCLKYSDGEPSKMCFYHPPNHRGCRFVNALFDKEKT